MDDLKLEAAPREILGKKTRFLRRQGITPVHLFGHSLESKALQCNTVKLMGILAHAGMTRPVNLQIEGEKQAQSVFIREIQKNPVSRQLLHVDFYQVKKGEKLKVDVPIVLTGEAPALKTKGRMLSHGITSLSIECLPESIPSQIEVDISHLEEVGQPIHVKDIVLDPGIIIHADPEQLVVKVSEALVKETEEEVAEAEVAAEAAEATAEAAETAEEE